MKTILVATDFSKNAMNAVKYAFSLAENVHARVVVIHAYAVPTSDVNIPFTGIYNDRNEARKAVIQKMDKLRLLCRKTHPLVTSTYVVEPGTPSNTIVTQAKKTKANLLVIGTTGLGAMAKTFLGSTTSSVIRSASCHIIAVPPSARFKEIKKITVATDLEKNSLETIKEVAGFARLFHAEIMFLHIQEPAALDKRDRSVEMSVAIRKKTRYNHISFHIGRDLNIMHGIEVFIRKNKAEMLSVATHKKTFMEKLLKTGWTEKLSGHISIPMLILHIPQK